MLFLMCRESVPVDLDAEARRIGQAGACALQPDASAEGIRIAYVEEADMPLAIDRIRRARGRRDVAAGRVAHQGVGIGVHADPDSRRLADRDRLRGRVEAAQAVE